MNEELHAALKKMQDVLDEYDRLYPAKPTPPEPKYKVGDTVFLPCKVVCIDEPYTLAPLGLDPKEEENFDFFVPREAVER